MYQLNSTKNRGRNLGPPICGAWLFQTPNTRVICTAVRTRSTNDRNSSSESLLVARMSPNRGKVAGLRLLSAPVEPVGSRADPADAACSATSAWPQRCSRHRCSLPSLRIRLPSPLEISLTCVSRAQMPKTEMLNADMDSWLNGEMKRRDLM